MANKGKFKRDVDFVERVLTKPFLAGIIIVAPAAVLGYVFHLISAPVQSLLKPLTTWVGGMLGLTSVVTGNVLFCLAVGYIVLSIIGALYTYSKIGHRVLTFVDSLLSRWAVWHALRKILKLPTDHPSDGPIPPAPNSDAVWVWIGGGYDLFGIRYEMTVADGSTLVSLWQLAVPMPTSFTERWANKAHTAPSGMSFSEATAYREQGGGELPAGAIPPPSQPPAYVLNGNLPTA